MSKTKIAPATAPIPPCATCGALGGLHGEDCPVDPFRRGRDVGPSGVCWETLPDGSQPVRLSFTIKCL